MRAQIPDATPLQALPRVIQSLADEAAMVFGKESDEYRAYLVLLRAEIRAMKQRHVEDRAAEIARCEQNRDAWLDLKEP